MSKVLIQTLAYNASKTIRRCVDSVVNQTYKGELEWHILDNGSTDDTLRLLNQYADQYKFISIFHIDENRKPHTIEENKLWNQFVRRINLDLTDEDYYCTLDSDDEYKPEYIEKLHSFCVENDLDVVAAGSDFINAVTNETMGIRTLNRDLVLYSQSDYDKYFVNYHALMRPMWGKLYKATTLKGYVRNDNLTYGSDTYCVFYTLSLASKVGIVKESLYKYYVSEKSVSYVWDEKRIHSDHILYEQACDFLISKTGAVSPRNDEFLLLVYMEALHDTLRVLLNAQLSQSEKIDGLCEMFLCGHAKRLAARENLGAHLGDVATQTARRKELYATAAQWLLSLKEISDEQAENYCKLVEYLCAVSENVEGWLFYKKLLVKYLIDNARTTEAKSKIDELLELLPGDKELLAYAQKL
ncbi:MAG: glycosyltransferase family 2 protein [Synergistaceae bacterium]|jgi:glycosyltransferase involved in cell wall biosynthesis|nr:glycosyltransferase family 2 protein [Synergistaceae bacterium]